MQNGTLGFTGELRLKRIATPRAPLSWRMKNTLRWSFIWGLIVKYLAKLFTRLTGAVTLTSELKLRTLTLPDYMRPAYLALSAETVEALRMKQDAFRRTHGFWTDYGVVSRRVVTDAGVAVLIDDFVDASGEVSNFKYHGVGTGTTAESAAQTDLITPSTTALNPDNTRATGTNTNPTAPVLRSIGTLTFDATAAITEHGLFNNATVGSGALWDRSVFSALNFASGDALQCTYELTANSGG